MKKTLELFMKNPYWKGIYDNAPSEEVKEYYRIMFEFFSFESDENDPGIEAAEERLMDLMLTRQDAEYVRDHSGMGIARGSYNKWIEKLFDEEKAEAISASFFRGELRNPYYQPAKNKERKERKMERTIRVKGRGKISVKPDTIRLTIEAEAMCKEYDEAVKKSAEDTAVLRETVRKAGLNPKDLKTIRFSVDTEYERYRDRNNDFKRKFIGYKYSHNMYVEFPNDNELLGRVLYALANCPVKVVFSIRHTVKDAEAVKNELLGKAVEDSRTKAEVLSSSAGVMLGDIITIDYSWGELNIYSEPMHNLYMVAEDTKIYEEASYNIDIEADDIDVQDTVTVVWEIE